MARLISVALLVSLLPSGLAGPACAQKHKTAADCMAQCNTKWGYPGLMMGTDPWGTLMHKTGSSTTDWNAYLAEACADVAQEEASSSTAAGLSASTGNVAATVAQGLATQPAGAVESAPPASSAPASSTTTTHSTTSTTTSRFTTSTRSSTTTEHTTTSTPEPTTTSTTQQAATTTAKPPQNTQTANTQSSNTQSSNSNTNSNSNSNSDSGSSSSGAGSNASPADQQAYLEAHNSIRAQHGAAPLTWSNDAAAKAQEWADKCTNTHSGGTLGPLGENLAAGTGTFTIAQAVKAWTDEVSEYNPNAPVASHFTQVVWKATTVVGCAVQTCNGIFAGFGAAQYYVCEYSVQGNVEGEFGANVQV